MPLRLGGSSDDRGGDGEIGIFEKRDVETGRASRKNGAGEEAIKEKTNRNRIGKTISPPLTARDSTWLGLSHFVGIPITATTKRDRGNRLQNRVRNSRWFLTLLFRSTGENC